MSTSVRLCVAMLLRTVQAVPGSSPPPVVQCVAIKLRMFLRYLVLVWVSTQYVASGPLA